MGFKSAFAIATIVAFLAQHAGDAERAVQLARQGLQLAARSYNSWRGEGDVPLRVYCAEPLAGP